MVRREYTAQSGDRGRGNCFVHVYWGHTVGRDGSRRRNNIHTKYRRHQTQGCLESTPSCCKCWCSQNNLEEGCRRRSVDDSGPWPRVSKKSRVVWCPRASYGVREPYWRKEIEQGNKYPRTSLSPARSIPQPETHKRAPTTLRLCLHVQPEAREAMGSVQFM